MAVFIWGVDSGPEYFWEKLPTAYLFHIGSSTLKVLFFSSVAKNLLDKKLINITVKTNHCWVIYRLVIGPKIWSCFEKIDIVNQRALALGCPLNCLTATLNFVQLFFFFEQWCTNHLLFLLSVDVTPVELWDPVSNAAEWSWTWAEGRVHCDDGLFSFIAPLL